MDVSYDMTVREMVAKYGRKVLDWKVADVAVMAEAKQQQRADGLSDTMTLTEFYVKCYKPEVSEPKNLKRNTLQQREQSLALWAKITGNPPLKEITKKTMVQFVTDARKEISRWTKEPISPATIHKHCSALRSVLDYAGPKSPKNRDAKELIPMPPEFPVVRVYLNPTAKTPTREEVQAVIKATECAEYPKLPEIAAPDWWRLAYQFLALTGVRKGDLLGIKWEYLRRWEGMWCVVIPAEVEKTGVEKVIPLSTAAQAILNEMPRGRPDDPIFVWPHSESLFWKERHKIILKAGLLRAIRGTWHAIRRFVGTLVPDAQLVLGHTSDTVTRRHYQSMTRAATALEAWGKEVEFGYG
ncbi:MAG: site-specific integrase [Planctomycetia bacterium]|nr:site-specific integrase [Planctomycetia bacterium]